ncbi:sodium/glucose cotransporter 2 [Plakobranchus ocellatus]|uniref:Sodium/glucose cotransporter 2 n=1 Tax=Plakobranchus ocellatus TaxID=259542 RepID=A0AAV4CHH7_9GAST|nr:sodium/glucose cotransporter 2 [Plakobranchus ocellatus]
MKAGITDPVDITVIAVYFGFVIIVGILSLFRRNRESVQGYFLAGRSMTWIPIGASLFASNIGSEHFIGLAGSGAVSGIGVVSFEWGAVLLLLLLGWVFLPIYLSSEVFTMPEYLGRRFGGQRMRIYLSLVALVLYVATKVSVDMYAGVFFIQVATGLDMYLAMIPLLAITAVYTVVGGLAAVVLTDTLQTVVMLVGAVILGIISFMEVGGLPGLYEKYRMAVAEPLGSNVTVTYLISEDYAPGASRNVTAVLDSVVNGTCGKPRDDAFHMFRDPVNSDLPWPGVVFRATFASLWNWCADQVIVQRALAAKNMAHARGATILAGYLKFTPLFLIIFPGMISRVLYPDVVACVGKEACRIACGNEAGCSNTAYPYLIMNLAPKGIRGLLMAVMVAALMSSLTSIFNSAVTVFTMDLWRRGRPFAKEKELLLVGRIFVVVLVGVSIVWIPLIMQSQGGQLFFYIQAVTGYIAPPISAIFILAVSMPRINEKTVGLIRLVLDFVYPSPSCGHEDDRPAIVSKVHFTYFSIVVFGVTAAVAIIVSFLTKPQGQEEIENLTFWTLRKKPRKHDVADGVIIKGNGKGKIGSTLIEKTQETQLSSESGGSNNTNPQHGFVETEVSTDGVEVTYEAAHTKPTEKLAMFKIDVDPPWSFVINANCVLLIAVLALLCGFFR